MASRRDSAGSQGGAHSRIVASSGTIEAASGLIRVIATELDGGQPSAPLLVTASTTKTSLTRRLDVLQPVGGVWRSGSPGSSNRASLAGSFGSPAFAYSPQVLRSGSRKFSCRR